ncbi:MAG: PQQ-binding-like beta-propeller repeat protein, partial [Spirochaetales bacterium]|nr:PQQ-binding-like beta-propeller repeat protein [Spirochaetales bacterium]
FGARLASWALGSSVVIEGDMLLVNACTSGVALKKKTGAKIWVSDEYSSGYATPVHFSIGKKKYAAFFGANAIYGVDIATGRVVWRDNWYTDFNVNAADPLIFGNKLFISSGYGKGCILYEFTTAKLTKKWTNENLAAHFSSPVYKEGYIYGISGNSGGDARFVVLNADTGEVVRSESTQFGNFIVVNGMYFLTVFEAGQLAVAEITPSSYRVISSAKLPTSIYWTAPVISGGRAYIRNERGDLYCIGMR